MTNPEDPHASSTAEGIEGTIDAALSGTRVAKGVFKAVRGLRLEHDLEVHARVLLGLDRGLRVNVGYRSDSVHALYSEPGALHPDNEDSLLVVAKPQLKRALDLDQLQEADDVRIELAGDIMLFGSPASDGLSRVIFGYALTEHEGVLADVCQPFEMAYRWELSDLRGKPVRRYVRGRHDPPLRPPWAIRNVHGRGERELYRPLPLRDPPLQDFLKDDYLLVTKVPSFLTGEYVEGSSIISFGGARGTATKAVKLLLRSHSVLRAIAARLPVKEGRIPTSYQILIYVSQIRHDPYRGSEPTKIELIDAVELAPREPYRTWDAAAEVAQPRLEEWLTRG